MASVHELAGGSFRIQFTNVEKKRGAVYLGKTTRRHAERVCTKIEAIITAQHSGQSLDGETADWIRTIPDTLAKKLAKAELIQHRDTSGRMKMELFIERYIESRQDTEPATRKAWRQSLVKLVECFGQDKTLESFTKADAKAFRLFLLGLPRAEATVRKYCNYAKTFFGEAVDAEIILRNPFNGVPTASVANDTRQQFVTRDEIQQVLDATPDAEFKLIIALSRFAALRCPSEHLALKWDDISWDKLRMTVRNVKTGKKVGREFRTVPITPELYPYLRDVWEQAEPGTSHVITKHRHVPEQWRMMLTRRVRLAGLKVWPRITHNLRASCENEWAAEFPLHIAASWAGNTPVIAQKHYLTVTEADFEKATQNPTRISSQHVAVSASTVSQSGSVDITQAAVTQYVATSCEVVHECSRERIGIEPTGRLVQTSSRV